MLTANKSLARFVLCRAPLDWTETKNHRDLWFDVSSAYRLVSSISSTACPWQVFGEGIHIDWSSGVLPNLRSIHLLWPLWPSTHSAQLRNWRCCFGDPSTKKWTYEQMCLAARCTEGLRCIDGSASRWTRSRPSQKLCGDLEWRCGAEGNCRVKQANCSVRDSFGYSVCIDQQQGGPFSAYSERSW